MKKFFVALMAVLVLASCAEKKTPEDVIKMTAEVMSVSAEKIKNAESADEVIAVLDVMYTDLNELDEKYSDVLEDYDEEDMPAEVAETLREAATEWVMALVAVGEEFEFTPEQEEKMMSLLEDF